MELIPGRKASMLAGNDKGKIYVIAKDCGEYAELVREDGKVLRKNKKHIQVMKNNK